MYGQALPACLYLAATQAFSAWVQVSEFLPAPQAPSTKTVPTCSLSAETLSTDCLPAETLSAHYFSPAEALSAGPSTDPSPLSAGGRAPGLPAPDSLLSRRLSFGWKALILPARQSIPLGGSSV